MATVMTSAEFVKRLKAAATDYKTLYVMGCFGAPMNSANKKRYTANHSYCKLPKERPMLCTDVRIPTDLPQKAFCRAWNLIVAKKLRYQATLRSTVDNAEDILVRYRAEEMCLLIDEIGKLAEFSYPLMLKTLDRVVVNTNGKLTFIFQSGIKITV